MPKKRNSLASRRFKSQQRASRHIVKINSNRQVTIVDKSSNNEDKIVGESHPSIQLVKESISSVSHSVEIENDEFVLELEGREFPA